MAKEVLSFGAGCFWGVEHAFKQLEGVLETRVGYQGGEKENPSYPEVCAKTTGHAEVVEVTFDNEVISLERLLDAFFFMHDPTQLNKQGPDVGPQYRSALFPTNDLQTQKIKVYMEKLKAMNKFSKDIVTTIEEGTPFYSAEDDHQDYLANNPGGYCHIGFDVFQKLKMGTF
jgi:peptide-methionine (S)-S-oxide reductase